MSLKTRLDPRSEDNNRFMIKNEEGFVLATIKILGDRGNTLEIDTDIGLHISKPNGWDSKPPQAGG